MSKNEICISEFELQNCNGNLRSLKTNWAHVPTVSSEVLSVSKGYSAEKMRSIIEETQQVSTCFRTLLDISLQLFTQIGIEFQESDRLAASNIDSITNK